MNIEKMGGGSTEKEPKIIIAELEKSFQDWLKENSDLAKQIKDGLIHIFGYDEAEMSNEGMAIIKVPLGKLSIFSTSCGMADNKPFNKKYSIF